GSMHGVLTILIPGSDNSPGAASWEWESTSSPQKETAAVTDAMATLAETKVPNGSANRITPRPQPRPPWPAPPPPLSIRLTGGGGFLAQRTSRQIRAKRKARSSSSTPGGKRYQNGVVSSLSFLPSSRAASASEIAVYLSRMRVPSKNSSYTQ